MVQRLKSVGVMSVAKTMAVLYAALGLLGGLIFFVITTVWGEMMKSGASSGMFPAIGGAAAIVVFPLLYGCIGFVGGAIMAWLYNMVAKGSGGVELDLE